MRHRLKWDGECHTVCIECMSIRNGAYENAANIADSVRLPADYVWDKHTIEAFRYGVFCAVEAIRALRKP